MGIIAVVNRELETATGEDIKAFLSELAVKGRVSRSTQKQALNAPGSCSGKAPSYIC